MRQTHKNITLERVGLDDKSYLPSSFFFSKQLLPVKQPLPFYEKTLSPTMIISEMKTIPNAIFFWFDGGLSVYI